MFPGTKKKSLADAYANMMEMDAWKELEEYARNEKQASLSRMDSKSTRDLSIGEVCEEIGIRKGIAKILRHAEDCRGGI